MNKLFLGIVILAMMVVALAPVSAHDAPSVEVDSQVSVNGRVLVRHVTSEGPGFIVIHQDNGGSPGPVAGFKWVTDGENDNVWVPVDAAMVTPVMYAMLHTDTGTVGVYEFGTVEGADGPVADANGNVITPAFNVQFLAANPQFVNGSFTVANVVTDAPGFIVIHSEQDGGPGPVLGYAPVAAGNNADVAVTIEGEATSRVWPMLHVDTGAAGVYEFGTVEGADGPVVINGAVAMMPISTVPTIVADEQIIVHGDNYEMMEGTEMMAPTFHAHAVLSSGPGFLVIHQDNNGAPGPVAGVAAVADGTNLEVEVELDPAMVTPVLWPMLHVDDGTVGTYEFGTVEGADAPVSVDGNVVTFPIEVAPHFTADDQALVDGTITIADAQIDAAGWLVIHSSVDGAPNAPLAVVKLSAGWNANLVIPIDFSTVAGAATDQVFPMLHYDTGAVGQYEFGTVEGADAPVMVGGNVVVAPLAIQ